MYIKFAEPIPNLFFPRGVLKRDKLRRRSGLALSLTLALGLSSLSAGPALANSTPSGSCSISGSVTIVGTVVTGHSSCVGHVTLSGVTEIGVQAFAFSSAITSVSFPDSLQVIGRESFYAASNLSSVTFGELSQLHTIGPWAFQFSGLTSIQIPELVTVIPAQAFALASSLSNVTMGSSITSIGQSAFWGTAMDSILIPDSVVTIAQSAFKNNYSLSSVVFGLGSQLQTIGPGAFEDALSLSAITIPATVQTIDYQAFNRSTGLSAVTFLGAAPASVGNAAFAVVAQGAQARVSRQYVDTFTLTAGKWNGLEVVVPSETLTLRSEDQDLIQNVEFGAVPSAPTAVREGFNLVGWSTQAGGGTLLLADLSDFVMGLEPTTLFAVWEEIPRPELVAETQEPVQFSGPLVSSVDRRVFDKGEPGTLTFKGKRMHLIRTVSVNGVELKIRSVTRHSITLELPAMAEGIHSLLVLSDSGSLSFRDFLSTR